MYNIDKVSALNWDKIRKYSQKAGQEMVSVAEAAYLTFKDPKVSYRQKAILLGSLAYLLSPIDAIPDLLPGGFTDDMSVLLGALFSAGLIGKEHLRQCREKRELVNSSEESNESIKTTTKK